MSSSVLTSTKKMLGLDEEYTVFDVDILMHINSVFNTLQQLGIGPEFGFSITDATTTWDDYLEGDLRLNSVKTYMALKVRLAFDPPATSFGIEALKEQIKEHEWRLNVQREGVHWIPPSTIIDGGDSLGE